jgi:glycerol-3-phosphate dehydrogenase
MPRHRLTGRRQALREMPALTPRIVAAGNYYDAKIARPERLVYELVEDGLRACMGSAAANATELLACEAGALTFRRDGGEPFTVRPKLVVNAAGPWIDRVNAMLGAPSKLIGGTKGSHILLKHDELIRTLDGRMIYFEADDGRICLVFDYLGRALVGSTDIPADNPDTVRCEADEIAYFLESLRALLPSLRFDRDQIVYAYSGIRPLPASDAANPGLISRDHSAPVTEADETRPFPIVSLVGGKWTTFRGFAQEVTDVALGRLGTTRRISTEGLRIGGGHAFPAGAAERQRWIAAAAAETGLDEARMEQLLSRYGTTALDVARHRGRWSDADRLADAADTSLAEIDHIARREAVVHLADIVMRRTTLAIRGDLTARDLGAIADVAAEALGWTPERRTAELDGVLARLRSDNAMRI